MIKLLFFCSDYNVGLTQALTEQAIALKNASGIALRCISSEQEMEPGLHEMIKLHEVQMDILTGLDDHKNFRSLAGSLARIIKDNNITHVNVHNNWQLALISFIKYFHFTPQKIKIIYTIHGYRHNARWKSIPAVAIIGSALVLFADRVISMSSYVSQKFWFVKYKTDLIFYMMNKDAFFKQNNEIQANPLKLVFPAQFRKGKHHEILIDAVAKYIDKTGDRSISLTLPGDGPFLQAMKDLTVKVGITHNVIFPGKLSHSKVIELYENSNIALCSSNVETYGRCIAEPFALGRCIITQKTGVAIDIIRDKENGIFFSDSESLVSILMELKDHPEKIVAIANKAFEEKACFAPEKIISDYLKAIENA